MKNIILSISLIALLLSGCSAERLESENTAKEANKTGVESSEKLEEEKKSMEEYQALINEHKKEEMEIIEILVEDINNDGKKEIISRLGSKGENLIDENMYKRLELIVLKNDGTILHYDEGFDSHSEGDSYIELVDLTGDGKKEIYYNQQHFTNFILEVISILKFEDDKLVELYNKDREVHDYKCVRLSGYKSKVFSQEMRKSFILDRKVDISVFDTEEMRYDFDGSEIVNDIEGLKAGIVKKYSIWDHGGSYGEAHLIYGFEDGNMTCKDFKFIASEGVKIESRKEGKEYDFAEEGKNKLVGFWSYVDNPPEGQAGERYMIKITDDEIINYIVNSDILSEEKYKVIELDKESQTIKLETEKGVVDYKILNDDQLEITFVNGHKSNWNRLQNFLSQ